MFIPPQGRNFDPVTLECLWHSCPCPGTARMLTSREAARRTRVRPQRTETEAQQ